MREPKIITNGETQAAKGRISHHCLPTGPVIPGFLVRLPVGQLHIKHVDLVVARMDPAIRPHEE